MALLHIYDADDPNVAEVAESRTDSEQIVRLAVTGSKLTDYLDAVVVDKRTFHRVLFDTHGAPGGISFGKKFIDAAWIRTNMVGRGYESLCPLSTRIYFSGCHVAADSIGLDFLRAIASVFLLRGGGSVFAYDSWGFSLRYALYSHVVHPWGFVIKVEAAPGGKIIETPNFSGVPPGRRRRIGEL